MQQLLFVDPNKAPIIKTLGPPTGASLRSFSDAHARSVVMSQKTAEEPAHKEKRESHRKSLAEAATARAAHYK
jgi:hypothetical protein